MPSVSVVMVFHRLTPFLVPAVESVFEQTLADLELVLVDNGVGPSARSALGERARDSRVRWVSMPGNTGIAAGHNAGVAVAQGEFIAMLDSDDLARPRRLERQVAALRADPGLGLVSSWADTIDEQGRVIGREFALTSTSDQYVFTAYSTPAPTPSLVGRADWFRRFLYPLCFDAAADYDFVARVTEATRTAAVPEVLLQYRHHGGQTTASRMAEQVLGACCFRLLTARRRAGRSEDVARTVAAIEEWAASGRTTAEIYRHFAERCLREELPLLSVYHARKALSVRRGTADVRWAVGLAGRAVRSAQSDRALLVRMFLGGPLRAHGLKRA